MGQMIPECRPDLVALIGCAGGFPGKIDQYDVAVPTHVHYIARTKVGAKTEIRPLQEMCSKVFVDHCKNVQLLDGWHQYLAPETSNAPINVYFEPIVSGETVLVNSSSGFYKSAQTASPKAVAIEMEGYGFLSACREKHIEAVIVRGISDTLDDKNKAERSGRAPAPGPDKAQFKATRHAAALFFATLDFVNPSAFSRSHAKIKRETTRVSMILDAEMHDVSEIQTELFEIFKKYGIKNFSFKPANSVRIDFNAQVDAMRIYQSLIKTGIVKELAGYKLLDFTVQTEGAPNEQLSALLRRIADLGPSSANDLLQAIRIENWIEDFPDYTKILIDTLKHHKHRERQALRRATGRILYPRSNISDDRVQREHYLGPTSLPSAITFESNDLRKKLELWAPLKASNEFLRWFMGDNLLDQEIGLDTLLAHSKRKLFYAWPGLAAVFKAASIPESEFAEACIAEWDHMRGVSGPSILQILDHERWDRLGKGQVREAIFGRPATLSKAIDMLGLTARIFFQNGLPARGCIIPSLYALSFNGVIAGDGVIERMLLTGMAGDLTSLADTHAIPLRVFQSAIKGGLLPHRCAADLAEILDSTILKPTRLRCAVILLGADDATHHREAVDLTQSNLSERYLVPF